MKVAVVGAGVSGLASTWVRYITLPPARRPFDL